MSDSVTIRGYEPPDLESCRRLWVALVQHHRDLYHRQSIGGDEPGREFDEHLALVGADRTWVAESGTDIVGLSGLIVRGREGELEPMIVSPLHRGRGVATALAAHVAAAARDLGLRSLSVRPVGRNRSAIGFFRDAGFELIGHVELFMWLGDERDWHDGETLAGRRFRI